MNCGFLVLMAFISALTICDSVLMVRMNRHSDAIVALGSVCMIVGIAGMIVALLAGFLPIGSA